ncbi:helix-turn-helix domain-containing protein [Dyella sp. 20L07]|uniref:helix-turn-helix domain-containing protein n=1 Tax=Dyella sp. 20L07 TaxID=3384240 RepID=UPI003D2A80BF
MSDARYINAAQQRVLKVLMLLVGRELEGLAPGEIATALKTTPSNITRDLANLREAGLVEQLDNGRFSVTPRFGQMALRILNALDRAQQRVEETRSRFTRNV